MVTFVIPVPDIFVRTEAMRYSMPLNHIFISLIVID